MNHFTRSILSIFFIISIQNCIAQSPVPNPIKKAVDTISRIYPVEDDLEEVEEYTQKNSPTLKTYNRGYYNKYIKVDESNIIIQKADINIKTLALYNKKVDSLFWTKKNNEFNIIELEKGYLVIESTDRYREWYKIENYITYKKGKKYGAVLFNNIIPAKYDSIGKVVLVRGKTPMLMVAKKVRRKFKWGIIDSKGTIIIPIKYNKIELPPIDIYSSFDLSFKYFVGLFQNQKIIVENNGKHGLYSAIGEEILKLEYDNISPNKSLDFYTLMKKEKFGFLKVKRSYIGSWGKQQPKNILDIKNVIVFPTFDFPVIEKKRNSTQKGSVDTYYLKKNNGVLKPINISNFKELK